MSTLAVRAELSKLRQLLGASDQALDFLATVPEAQLRRLRHAVSEHLFIQDRPVFRRLAWLTAQLPTAAPLLARLAGPLLAARIVSEMPAHRGAALAQRVSPAFLAELCAHLDPRSARDLILQIPVPRIIVIARELVRRRDYPTMGRFVDFLSDEAIQAALEAIPDEAELLRVAFYMDSRNRLDHVVRMLPPQRRRRAVLLALDQGSDLLDEILSLVTGVNYSLQHELGDLAAAQETAVIERIIWRVQERELWGDLLPVVSCLSPEHQRKVANLPFLKDRPDVLRSILGAADTHQLWRIVLPLVEMFDEPMRDACAQAAVSLPPAAMASATHATLVGELWQPMLDLVRRMSFAKQCEFAGVLKGFCGVDPALDRRVIDCALRYGLRPALDAAGINTA